MKTKLFAILSVFALVFSSCNKSSQEPTGINDDGTYTIKIAAPAIESGENSNVAPRSITGNYNLNPYTYFSFTWDTGDTIRIIPFNAGGSQLGEEIEHIVSSSSSASITIDVTFPKGTDHFTVKCGPKNNKVQLTQPCELNKITKGMMLFAAENCKLDGKTVKMTAQWSVLVVSPIYSMSYPSGLSWENIKFKVGINKIVVTQYFSSSESYTINYKNATSVTSEAKNATLSTPCPIVVYPAPKTPVQKPCSLKISIHYDDAFFKGTVDGEADDHFLIPSQEVGVAEMYTDFSDEDSYVFLDKGQGYTFFLEPEQCEITWVWNKK